MSEPTESELLRAVVDHLNGLDRVGVVLGLVDAVPGLQAWAVKHQNAPLRIGTIGLLEISQDPDSAGFRIAMPIGPRGKISYPEAIKLRKWLEARTR